MAADTTGININSSGAAQHTYDAIVIGSGISGGWAPKSFASRA